MWKEVERERRHRLTEQQEAAVRRDEEEWTVETGQTRGVRYDWKQQEDTMRDVGVTSGAAAVLSRRRHSDSGSTHDGQSPSKRLRHAGNDSLDAPHMATASGYGRGGASGREPLTVSKGHKRQRDGEDDDSEELERRRLRDAYHIHLIRQVRQGWNQLPRRRFQLLLLHSRRCLILSLILSRRKVRRPFNR